MDSTQRTRPRTGGSPVGLVIFIALTVVFALLAYWMFAKYQQADQATKDTQTKLDTTGKDLKAALDVTDQFRKVSGVSTPDSLKTDIKSAAAAIKAEGIGDVSDTASASDVLKAVPGAISSLKTVQEGLAGDNATVKAQLKSLTEQKKASEATFEADVAAKIAENQALHKELDDQKAKSVADFNEEVAQYDGLRDTYYTERDTWNAERSKMLVRIEDLLEKNRRISGEGAVIEKADGSVTATDLENGLVTIDIGSEAGVKAQMHFLVFTWDSRKNAVIKGSIEIVKALPRVAVGQITNVKQDTAFGKGDLVYNLAGPRKKLFVFVGQSVLYNIPQWTTFIRASGGDVTDQIQRNNMVADYLVMCKYDSQDPKAVQVIRDARDFGVKILTENQLKEYLGLK